MKKYFFSILFFLVSLGLSAGLFVWLYKDAKMSEFLGMLEACDLFWVIFPLIIYWISDVIRGWRWKILLNTSGIKISIWGASLPVFVAGISNYIFPRIGEVVRTGIVKQTHKVPISTSIGTIITERLVDLICFMLLAIVVIVAQFDRIGDFVLKRIDDSIGSFSSNLFSIISFVIGAIVIFVFIRQVLRKKHFYKKLQVFFAEVKRELLSIFRLGKQQAYLYFFLTLFMWFLYFAMYYALFSMNERSAGFTIMAVLSTMVLGTLGFLLPVPGAIGTFHFFVTYALVAYNIDGSFAKLLAAFMHGNITIVTLISGSFCVFVLLLQYKGISIRKIIKDSEAEKPAED